MQHEKTMRIKQRKLEEAFKATKDQEVKKIS